MLLKPDMMSRLTQYKHKKKGAIPVIEVDDGDEEPDAIGDDDVTDGKTTEVNIRSLAIELGAYEDEYPYLERGHNCCTVHYDNFEKPEKDKISEFVTKYYANTKVVYDRATRKILGKITKELLKLPEHATGARDY